MIDHTGIGVADVGRSADFYDAALATLGMRRVRQMPDNVGSNGIGYGVAYPVFWIDRYHPHSVKQHTAFAANSTGRGRCIPRRSPKGRRNRKWSARTAPAELLRRICARSGR